MDYVILQPRAQLMEKKKSRVNTLCDQSKASMHRLKLQTETYHSKKAR